MEPESDTDSKPGRQFTFPQTIDQGCATVIAAIIALVGTIAVVVFSNGTQPGPPPTSVAASTATSHTVTTSREPTIMASSTPPPSSTAMPSPTPPSSDTAIPSSTPPTTLTVQPAIQPTVQLLSALSTAQEEDVQTAASGILLVAQNLPLMIRDDFDSNDYAWPETEDTFEKGIQCAISLTDSQYRISVRTTSTSGPGWCYSSAPRGVSDFYLSFESQLLHHRNADIWLYYRYVDDSNFHYLHLHPQQTQLISWGVRLDGRDTLLIQSAFIPAVHKTDPNKLTLLVLGGSHTLYINDRLTALISNVPNPDAGQIRFGVQLNEADEVEELQIDKFELRGD